MKFPTFSLHSAIAFFLLSTFSWSSFASTEANYIAFDFVSCLRASIGVVYAPTDSNYTSALLYSINNLRFAQPQTPKPIAIAIPDTELQISAAIFCCKTHGVEMRVRSGGHSFEGLSYVANVTFMVLDLRSFNKVTPDLTTATAWVDSGVTNGELYYWIAQATSAYGFPSGLWSNVGVGGIISGGGYGMMRRKFGLAADQVINARLIDANGMIHTRLTMGEELFWAIRGGGGGSFGIVVSWQVNLIPVPEIVTVFRVNRTLEQNMTNTFYRWQSVAPNFPYEMDIRCTGQAVLSEASPRADKKTMAMLFESLYLGRADDMLLIMQEQLPELGLVREDCFEVSWIQAMQFFSNFPLEAPPEILLDKTLLPRPAFKGRSDFTKVPIPIQGLEGIWDYMFQLPNQTATLQFTPYGGRMNEISDSATPFPYRAGYLYMINFFALTDVDEAGRMQWVRNLDTYFTPYVTSNPRSAYVNYVNLWMGTNNPTGTTSYAQARVWGERYFKNNFRRLVSIKTVVDPLNFFRHEQSIPPFSLFSDM